MSKHKVESIEHLIKALETSIKTHKRISISISDNPEYNSGHNEGYTAACEYAISLAEALQETQSTRLTAAAPELLKTLKSVSEGFCDDCSKNDTCKVVCNILYDIEQVIANAED